MANTTEFSTTIGPCNIYCGLDSNAIALGSTLGPVRLTIQETAIITKTTQTGSSAQGKYISGISAKLTGAITLATLDQIAVLLGTTAGTGYLYVKDRTGTNLIVDASDGGEFYTIRPIIGGVESSDEGDWIFIPKGSIMANFDIPFALDGEGDQKAYGFEIEAHELKAADLVTGAIHAESANWAAGHLLRFGAAA